MLQRLAKFPWIHFTVVGVAAFLILHQVGDTWWTLRLGEDFWHGQNIFKERWSWTAYDTTYSNHEWLYEVTSYGLWLVGGKTLIFINLVHATLIATALSCWPIAGRATRSKASALGESGLMVALLLLMAELGFMELRAMIVSYFFTAFMLHLLRREQYKWIPALMLLWVNFHGGFFQGILILGVAWAVALAFAWRQRSPEAYNRFKSIGISGFLATLVTLLNPLGWRVWLYLWESLEKTSHTVIEFRPVWETEPYFQFFMALSLGIALLILLRGKVWFSSWDTALTLTMALILWPLALTIARFTPLLLMVSYPLMRMSLSMAWPRALSRLQKLDHGVYAKISSKASIVVALVCLGVVILGLAMPWKHSQDQELAIPAAGVSALKACKGNVYNDYNAGSYLLWWAKDHKVFLDNRYDPYPKEISNFSYLSPENVAVWREFSNTHGITCAFVTRYGASDSTLGFEGWKPRWADSHWVLFEKP